MVSLTCGLSTVSAETASLSKIFNDVSFFVKRFTAGFQVIGYLPWEGDSTRSKGRLPMPRSDYKKHLEALMALCDEAESQFERTGSCPDAFMLACEAFQHRFGPASMISRPLPQNAWLDA